MQPIFKNNSGDLRAGWQIALFLAILSCTMALPLVLLGTQDMFVRTVIALFGVLATTFIATRFINHKPFVAVGLSLSKHTMRELGIGCVLGWLMLTGVFGLEYLLGYVKVSAAEFSFVDGVRTFGVSVVFWSVAALAEELLFRGYMFQTLIRGIRLLPASLLVGALFGLAHIDNPNSSIWGVANTVLVSIVFGFAYWRTRSLWLPFGIHFAWNFSQTTLYGYPTSGIHFNAYELTRLTQFGPEWLTGGAYGPEGGAIATLTIFLCGVYIYMSKTLRPFPGAVTLNGEVDDLGDGFFQKRGAA